MSSTEAITIQNVRALRGADFRTDLVDLFIEGGTIKAVTAPAARAPEGVVLDGRHRLAVPGFINGHQHSHELFFRGRSEKRFLEAWMTSVRPARGLPLTPDDVYWRTLAVAAEALASGTTTIVDDVGIDPLREAEHLDAAVQAYRDSGIRALIGPTLFDIPFAEALPFAREELPADLFGGVETSGDRPTIEDKLAAFRDFARRLGTGRVRAVACPSAPQRCTPDLLRMVRRCADDLGLPVLIHVQETRLQAADARLRFGGSMVGHLDRLDFLKPGTTLIHAVWLDDREIALLARTGAGVQHDPWSNLKLGSGAAPVRALLDAGVNVSLGSDGCGSVETVSLQPSLAAAPLLSALRGLPETWLSAREALGMATTAGARAFGLEREIGAIEPGRSADLVLYRLDRPPFVPLNDPVRQLVFGDARGAVDTVIVEGRVVVAGGRLQTIDEDRLAAEVAARHARLLPAIEAAEAEAARLEPAMRRIFCRCLAVPLPGVHAARFEARPAGPAAGETP